MFRGAVILSIGLLCCTCVSADDGTALYDRLRSQFSTARLEQYDAEYSWTFRTPGRPGMFTEQRFSVIQSGKKYRLTRQQIQPDNTFFAQESWDGSVYVFYETDKDLPENENRIATIDNAARQSTHDRTLGNLLNIYEQNQLRAHFEKAEFDANTQELTTSSPSLGYKEVFHFVDTETLQYDKLIRCGLDQIETTIEVQDWVFIDGTAFPAKSQIRRPDGTISDTYALHQLHLNPEAIRSEDFVSPLPFSSQLYVYDARFEEYVQASKMDATEWNRKAYLAASERGFLSRVRQDSIKDISSSVLQVMPPSSVAPPKDAPPQPSAPTVYSAPVKQVDVKWEDHTLSMLAVAGVCAGPLLLLALLFLRRQNIKTKKGGV
jgi:hypothetical protein